METGIAHLNEIFDMVSELVLKEKDTELKARLRKQSKEVNAGMRKLSEYKGNLTDAQKEELLSHIEKANKSVKESIRDGRKVARSIQVLNELINTIENLR
jgi:hypothetical protein